MTNPGTLLRLALCAALMVAAAARALAENPGRVFQKDRTDNAIDRATKYLVSRQDGDDGSIHDVATKPSNAGDNRTAMTSLAVLAMAAAGHQVTDATVQGQAMRRAIRFVLQPDRQDDNGYFGNKDGSRMYGHGATTVMLSEMLGQGLDDDMDQNIRRRVTKAVDLILRAQQLPRDASSQGGWRYTPDDKNADISVTVWQLMALRAARNAGLTVPPGAVRSGLEYVNRCYLGAPGEAMNGFGYYPQHSKFMSPSTTSMGLLALELCGEHDSANSRSAASWLAANPPTWGNTWQFYGCYYYSQAMFQCGGQYWSKARQVVAELLLSEQRTDGSWESGSSKEREVGSVFTTSLGVLSLAVKYHYLPIYQR